ncbi:MAG TPA: hypothetical protein VFU47_10570 [Armatimonadota bacterium]|nr:hypothetical protein [Armatimonadota bacterium]
MNRNLLLLCCLLLAPAGHTAPSTRVRVDGKGVLRLTRAQLHALGVAPAKDGMVGVQFPLPPEKPRPKSPAKPAAKTPARKPAAPKTPAHAHELPAEERAPTVWSYLRPDGSVLVGRTRAGAGYLPGPPGTLYTATGAKNRVVLKRPS